MKSKQDAAKQRQEWAATHVGPIKPDCQHNVTTIRNGVRVCTQCNSKAVV